MSESANSGVKGEEYCFLGEFEHSLDPQRRVAIPSAWRKKEQNERFILVPGRDRILQLIPYESFKENFLSKAKKVSLADAEGASALARLGSRAQECVCDKQGRVQINPRLLDYAGLKGQVVLVGAVSMVQIWDAGRWKANQISDDSYFDEVQKISDMQDDLGSILKGTLNQIKQEFSYG